MPRKFEFNNNLKNQRKMKKIFGIIAVSAFLFASCGNTNNTEAVEETTEPQTEEVVVEENTEATEMEATDVEATEENAEVAEVPAE